MEEKTRQSVYRRVSSRCVLVDVKAREVRKLLYLFFPRSKSCRSRGVVDESVAPDSITYNATRGTRVSPETSLFGLSELS
jgi:hypothetical protein